MNYNDNIIQFLFFYFCRLEIYAEGKHALHYMYPDLIHAKIDKFLTSEH